MAIISASKKTGFRGYGNTQFRYAMTYVVITLVVLIFLNIYCSGVSHKLFYQSKESSMIEKCLLASDEISTLHTKAGLYFHVAFRRKIPRTLLFE